MELTYNELRKRDVINVADGRCLGRIIDLRLSFPEGVLVGIVVPGRKVKGILRCFDKSELYIDESRILKIGGDVILVDINCGDMCSSGVRINKPLRPDKDCEKCPPSCPPPRPQPCSPPCTPQNNCKKPHDSDCFEGGIFSGVSGRIDTDDY